MRARRLEAVQLLDEKVLQRYVFERLNESTRTRARLLPSWLQPRAARLRVVIPEYLLSAPDHRPDFRLIFSDGTAVNAEVEWTRRRFRSHGQGVADAHYSGQKGFIIGLQDDRSRCPSWLNEISMVELDVEDFTWWFNTEGRRMLESSLSFHLSGARGTARRFWVVYVGRTGRAQDDYLSRGLPSGLWAFRYTMGLNLKNIMAIQRGDLVVFAAKWSMPAGKARMIYPGVPWECRHIDVLEVSDGYWCDFRDPTFEKPSWSGRPEDKEYMHYIAFSSTPRNASQIRSREAEWLRGADLQQDDPADAELATALRMSNTQSGAPFPISINALEALRRHLA